VINRFEEGEMWFQLAFWLLLFNFALFLVVVSR